MILSEAIAQANGKTLCVSLSAQPGTFGTTVHTAGYRALGLDFAYCACQEDDIARAMNQVRDNGVRGASISMPHKISVMRCLDSIDEQARKVGAVNTVVNTDGHLRGYNTDVTGFQQLMITAQLLPSDRIIVLGSGGVAKAVLEALRGYNVELWARNGLARVRLALEFGVQSRHPAWMENDGGTFINCTPIGMNDEPLPLELSQVDRLIDLVVKETPALRAARALKIPAYSGKIMSLFGAAAQFELYTGIKAPIEKMKEAANVKA